MMISNSNGAILSNTTPGEQYSETNLDITTQVLNQSSNANFDLSKLLIGNVFEGLITDVRNNQVTIQIDGQNLVARLEESININIGQNLSFKVQSNDGTQISIKPIVTTNSGNEIFSKALSQANLPLTERNFQMIQIMMDEKMPVDKKSVQEMFRQISQFPKENVSTIIQMNKLEFPVTQGNIIQFENYKNMEHQIGKSLNQVVEEFLPLLSESWNEEDYSPKDLLQIQTSWFEVFQAEEEEQGNPLKSEISINLDSHVKLEIPIGETLCNEIFIPEELENLYNYLEKIEAPKELLDKVKTGMITPKELVVHLKQIFQGMMNGSLPKEELGKLFSSREYQGILKNVMQDTWFIKPEELFKENKVDETYKQLYRHMNQIETIVEKLGKEESSLLKNVTSIKSNLEFMNQVNHVMSYVQIPLKMINQKAHSDLYVFTNKRSLSEKEGKLSALMHLDMDALGSIDIYVQMEEQKADTQFHVEDEISFDLIMENAHILTSRLEAKGYQCTVEMKTREKKVDFIEDFLKREQPGNKMLRYSFDVRA